MNVKTENMPRFLRFLVNIAEGMREFAGMEFDCEIEHEVVEILPRSDTGSGLTGLKVRGYNAGGQGDDFEVILFAAGTYRNKSMVKITREGEEAHALVSSSPKVVFTTAWYGL